MCLSKDNFSYHRSAFPVQTKYTSVQGKGNEYRIMSIKNLSKSGTQTKTYKELLCSPSLVGGLQQESVSFAAVNIFLSITTFLGNSLILVALHKESSLHPPSKLLYRCLATTDLLVGLVAQPLHVTYWMSIVHEHRSLCYYAGEAAYITGAVLCGVSLLTMTAISVDRLIALLSGLRYKEIVTLKRIYIIIASFWVLCLVASLSAYNRFVCLYIDTNFTAYFTRLVHKDISHSQKSSGTSTRSCSTTAEPTKCTENGAIQKGSTQCTVDSVSISCFLYTILCSGNCSQLQYNIFITISHHRGNDNYPCLL